MRREETAHLRFRGGPFRNGVRETRNFRRARTGCHAVALRREGSFPPSRRLGRRAHSVGKRKMAHRVHPLCRAEGEDEKRHGTIDYQPTRLEQAVHCSRKSLADKSSCIRGSETRALPARRPPRKKVQGQEASGSSE